MNIYSTKEVAEKLSIHPRTVLKLINNGELQAKKVANKWRITEGQLKQYLEEGLDFNNGNPYHGSEKVQNGKLTGATDTDWFYFFCPDCNNNQILQISDYKVEFDRKPEDYLEKRINPKRDFKIAFELYCPKCKLHDFVKISNTGWQAGNFQDNPYI